MAQDYIKINNKKVWQPDSDTAVAFETTYTQGSTRAQSGKGKFTPMFTVERFTYSASDVPMSKVTEILEMVAVVNLLIYIIFCILRRVENSKVLCRTGIGH